MPAPDYSVEIAQLEAGMASGEVTIEDERNGRVTYRSVNEIKDALTYFRDKQSMANAPYGSHPFVTVASFTRY